MAAPLLELIGFEKSFGAVRALKGVSFTLAEGDSLYIPRGILHEARTGTGSSLHLTLSVHPVTWRDVVSEARYWKPVNRPP